MITDIPTAQDFEDNGLAFLNLAWASVTRLSQNYFLAREMHEESNLPENVKAEVEKERVEVENNFWRQSQPALATAVALAHQGGEFLLKARIVQVSPFLLLSSERWPKGADVSDQSFANFKTVDAQELVKIHDTVCSKRLPAAFRTSFENLRILRNTVMHSVDKRKPFTPRDCILAILQLSETLIGERSWQLVRRKYVSSQTDIWDPYSSSDLNPAYPLAEQTLHVIDKLLSPAEALRFYGFNKKQRRYLCTLCHEEYADEFVWSVQLESKSPTATKAACVCCQAEFCVKREQCAKSGCKGNVLGLDRYEEAWTCLTCNKAQYYEQES